jgi:GNAT superfamily N-acetyltransferase
VTQPDRDECQLVDGIEAAAFRDMCRAAPAEFVDATGLRCLETGGATLIVAPGVPTPMFNRAIGLGVNRAADDGDIDAVCAAFRDAGSSQFWVHVSPVAEPANLAARLGDRGFRLARRRAWAKMLYDGDAPADAPCSLTIREVGPAQADALGAAIARAFDMPASFANWFRALIGRAGWSAVAGFDGATLACGGFVYRQADFAWLGAAGTLPEFRRRGGQRAVMTRRLRLAIEDGARVVATETGEPVGDEHNPSLGNMRRCGFRSVCSRLNYEAR